MNQAQRNSHCAPQTIEQLRSPGESIGRRGSSLVANNSQAVPTPLVLPGDVVVVATPLVADLPELLVARQEERIQLIAPQAQFHVPHNAELVCNDGLRMGVQKRPYERMATSRITNEEAERFHVIEQAAVADAVNRGLDDHLGHVSRSDRV